MDRRRGRSDRVVVVAGGAALDFAEEATDEGREAVALSLLDELADDTRFVSDVCEFRRDAEEGRDAHREGNDTQAIQSSNVVFPGCPGVEQIRGECLGFVIVEVIELEVKVRVTRTIA